MQQITWIDYLDKVKGGWIGKCAGGILGAPIEGYKTFRNVTVDDTLFENNFPNDDLDLQILWLDMVKQKGPYVRANDYRDHWRDHVNFPWNEYGIATLNIRQGLDNPDTGRHNNAYWSQSMGSPIRSELWGMLCPGSPAAAARYAKMDSTFDHTGFSVDAEMFFSASAALAFFESDIRTIMDQATQHTDGGQLFTQLYQDVTRWHGRYGEETAKHKIKSTYGDADFTSAPQNVGLVILALLAFGDSFDTILESINYGHDSDCIIATAAALIGIIKGYEAIPSVWKSRIGESLMVSPEVTGIAIPETVSQLTEETGVVGLTFTDYLGDTKISKVPTIERKEISPPAYHLTAEIDAMPDVASGEPGQLSVRVENFRSRATPVALRLTSPVFESHETPAGEVEGQSSERIQLPLVWNTSALEMVRRRGYTEKNFPYTLEVTVGDETVKVAKGVPFYGSWILAGPFITDDPAIAPMHETYPDHGLASMPSITYMNHDQVARRVDFLDDQVLDQLLGEERDALPFASRVLFPQSHRMAVGDAFYGRGERTLYLLTTFAGRPSEKKWLCIGANGYVRVWHNRSRCYASDTLRRRWPLAHYTELALTERNELLIRIDYPVDQFDVTVGFKEHYGQHPHQSQWDPTLIPQ